METLDDLKLDREHLAHVLYECRDGRHPATRENQADLQRELEELDAKIACLTDHAWAGFPPVGDSPLSTHCGRSRPMPKWALWAFREAVIAEACG